MSTVPKSVDRNVFRNTAMKTKKLNILKYIPRGGIRLQYFMLSNLILGSERSSCYAQLFTLSLLYYLS